GRRAMLTGTKSSVFESGMRMVRCRADVGFLRRHGLRRISRLPPPSQPRPGQRPLVQILRLIFQKGELSMALRPDPTFYPSPRMAMQAQPERLAYVALLNVAKNGKRDAMGVVNLDASSKEYGQLIGQTDFPHNDNELHHFGWNACSACLCH